jgi:outer membrane lipoprotein-sorting protein
MKIRLFITVCSIVFSFAAVSGQTADEILNKHFSAIGLLEYAKINTIKISGKITSESLNNDSISYLQIKVRPYKQYMEFKNKNEVSKSVFDGRTEWSVTKGKTIKSPFDVEEQRKRSINFEGELHYCKNNGYQIEYLGLTKIEGLDFHKIRVTNKDGYDASFFIDPGSFMLMKSSNGSLETYYSNFKMVKGITLPYSVRVLSSSGNANELNIDTIELNTEIDANLFVR